MIKIIPISVPQVNNHLYLTAASKVIGKPITDGIDQLNIKPDSIIGFIGTLGSFQSHVSDVMYNLRNTGSLLKHIMISFIIVGEKEDFYQLAIDADIDILDCDACNEIIIASASLERWRTTVINYSSNRITSRQQEMCTKLLEAFDKLGLSIIFENYSRKKDSRGNTFLVPS